jgi:hypothetical protein
MSSTPSIRGARVGAGPMGEKDRGHHVDRITKSFYCANGHETHPFFAATVLDEEVPARTVAFLLEETRTIHHWWQKLSRIKRTLLMSRNAELTLKLLRFLMKRCRLFVHAERKQLPRLKRVAEFLV